MSIYEASGKQTCEKFTAFSQYHSAGRRPRGRITTTTKTNGSISSKAGIVFYGNWTDMLPGDCVYAPWLGPAFKNNTDQPIRVFINIAPSGFERFFAEAAEAWAQPELDMTRIAAIAEKTDFNPREVRGKKYLCARLHLNIRGPAGTTFPYRKRGDGQLWPFSKQDCYVYHKRELSMQECMLRSDAPSHTLPVLPLRVVPQSDFIIARCKSILCTRSFPMGHW